MRNSYIIFLTYYHFPCHEPALENVFAKELGKRSNILWLFQGDITKGRIKTWHNSKVLISRKIKGNFWLIKLINKLLAFEKYVQLVAILVKKKVKIIIIRDMPIQTIIISLFRFIFKFKIYFQYTAPLGEINIGYSNSIKKLKKYWFYLSGLIYNLNVKYALEISDLVFPISEYHKDTLSKFIEKNKLIVTPMGVDEDWLKRSKNEISFLKDLKKNNILIVYFGTLNFSRNPLFLIKIFRELKNKYNNCKLLLVGRTSYYWEEIQLKSFARYNQLENDIIFTGYISRNLLKDYLSYCDISICAIPPEKYFRISSPTKLYESLGNGVPVIANRGILEQERVINQSEGGLIVDYDKNDFSDAILKLINDSSLRKNMGKKGKEYILKHYSYKVISKKIMNYFLVL